MSFSLALAGSVMVTVSVISILPECLVDEETHEWISWDKLVFRILFFGLGWGLYLGLSYWFHVPEPEELLSSTVLPVVVSSVENGTKSNFSNDSFDTLDSSNSSAKDEKEEAIPFLSESKNEDNVEIVLSSSNQNIEQVRSRRNHSPKPHKKDHKKNQIGSTSVSDWTSGKDLQTNEQKNAWRVAMLLFFSLLFHNFPEGLAVAASALESQKLGITVTIGIMIHNIPEGIAIAIPCLAARPNQPWLSFFMASVSGLAEPFGAFVALMFLRLGAPISSKSVVWNLENILALVAGIMIAVAVCELFPEATRHVKRKNWNYFTIGTVSGIIVMILTEWYT